MSIDKKTVEDVAHLSRIELGEKELEKLSGQLEHILAFIDKLSSLNTENIAPTNHILPLNNVLRKDEPQSSLPIKKTLQNAPEKQGNSFVVPKVIE
ncbi:MAG: Asp-tRNA(Asn)/Glu-tRNA(Gln) amidotransferase subunit GatC [Candidatus Omnitrophica bacterium]|nr:Asp-tRNA(Asn)/Glu-tRNA(Gln) amidotransferase subunit GatC [Candidatus Omnitrophota bacterium]MDD5027048.1 Asp-tRNA(Asn)/Glu-tRNA(Gln) amidotransferase subunit GatC [Candidatus Omnitrophota bacterium]MDD5661850.1 Asp-tRNA(Asn)/Glu-tRNA(Gln) amidotransferase subunit GatC [Candidatus Omnitrophota bacterium]